MLTQENAKAKALFDEKRTRCGYNNAKVGIGTPTISTMCGTPESIGENASKTMLAVYGEMITKYARQCTTCHCDCPGCYAKKLKMYSDVFEKYLLNTIELFSNPDRFYELIEKELYSNPFSYPLIVRMHESGEFAGKKDIAAFLKFAARHPETIFFGYSKDKNIQELQLEKALPENVRFACSPWILADGTVLCAPVGDVYQFIFNDGSNPAFDKLVKCYCSNPDGSVNKGATCTRCGRCVRCKDGEKTAVFPHGVGLANSWLAGRTRYYMTAFNMTIEQATAAAYDDALKQGVPAWREKAAADLQNNISKLVKAMKAAEKKAKKAAAENVAAAAD